MPRPRLPARAHSLRIGIVSAALIAVAACGGSGASTVPSAAMATPSAAAALPSAAAASPSAAMTSEAPTVSPQETSGTVDSTPSGSPLTLLWQTKGPSGAELVDPIHLAMSPDGNIYVGSATPSGLIQVFDPNGKFVTGWGSKGSADGEFSFLLGLGIDPQGNVYAGDFSKARVNKFDGAGSFLLQWPTEQPVGPAGVAVDGQGNVFVVNHRTHDHQIQKFDASGELVAEWGSNGAGEGQIGAGASSGPEDLAVDGEGNVYVADRVNDRVEKYDGNGKFLATIGTPGTSGQGQLSGPGDVTVDGDGNVYVLDDAFLQKFDPSGAFLAEWSRGTGPLQNAGEVMADANGDLYVNTDVLLEKFSQ